MQPIENILKSSILEKEHDKENFAHPSPCQVVPSPKHLCQGQTSPPDDC